MTARAEELERRLAEAEASAGTRGTHVDAGAEPPAKTSSDRHVVEPGESLWSISAKPDVYGEGARWNQLYQSNKDRIRDPNRIYPGQEIQIPR